jgi:hypothetical protein
MTESHSDRTRAFWTTLRVRESSFIHALMLCTIFSGFYAYWIFWKLKFFYIGWAACMILLAALLLNPMRWSTRGLGRALGPVVLWYLYLAASSLWSPDPITTLSLVAAGALFVMAFVAGFFWSQHLTWWEQSKYFQLLVLVMLPVVAYFVVTTGRLYDESLGAVRTGLATTGLLSLPFLVWRAKNRPTVLSWALVAMVMLLLIGGGSRTAPLIAMFALVTSVGLVQRKDGDKLRSLFVAVVGSFALFAIALVLPPVRQAAMGSFTKLTRETTFNLVGAADLFVAPDAERVDFERRLQAAVAAQSFIEHPIRGAGYFSTLAITRDQYNLGVGAHGLPALLLGETGLIGTAIFTLMLVLFFRRTRRAIQMASTLEERGFVETLRLTMWTMLLFGLFHQVDQSTQFFVVLAYGYGLNVPVRFPLTGSA